MLSPENWQEYQYRVDSSDVNSSLFEIDWRLWRVTITVAAGAGGAAEITIGNSNFPGFGVYGPVLVPAGTQLVLEPKGMFPAILSWDGATAITIERIRRLPTD